MKITHLEPLVEKALRFCEETRRDDFILYLEVLKQLPIDTRVSVEKAFKTHKSLGLPSFESVTRCRRKLQERDNTLKDDSTALKRDECQRDFINYAMCDKVIY